MVNDLTVVKQVENLFGDSEITWRSGIKHDCSDVMELKVNGEQLIGANGAILLKSSPYLYPFMKSSDVAGGNVSALRKYVVVSQKKIGQSTEAINTDDPSLWKYLNDNASSLASRKSRVYQNAPKFSVFGVGDYSFLPYKVAISGLYKKFHFAVVSPQDGKPVMLDDTCYFIGFSEEKSAKAVCHAMNHDRVLSFLYAVTFPDSKRPITADILNSISLRKVCETTGITLPDTPGLGNRISQLTLF